IEPFHCETADCNSFNFHPACCRKRDGKSSQPNPARWHNAMCLRRTCSVKGTSQEWMLGVEELSVRRYATRAGQNGYPGRSGRAGVHSRPELVKPGCSY